jgi:hypothetical protein
MARPAILILIRFKKRNIAESQQMNGTKDGRTVTWMVFIVIFISFRNSTWLLVAIDSDRKVSSVHLSVHPCVINFHIFNLFFWANSCPVPLVQVSYKMELFKCTMKSYFGININTPDMLQRRWMQLTLLCESEEPKNNNQTIKKKHTLWHFFYLLELLP